jgi:cytochrome c
MIRSTGAALCGLCLTLFSAAAGAAPHTKADAQAMVQKASAFIKANGREKALAEFNNPQGGFVKGDLYLFATDFNGVILAHANPKMVGKNLIDLRDSDGKLFVRGLIETAVKGGGWYGYKWVNPAT